MKWSKLKQVAEGLFDPGLGIELKCTAYRMAGSRLPGVGRIWVVMDEEIIWDVPKDLPKVIEGITISPYEAFLPAATGLIRRYVETPVAGLESLSWPDDPAGLPDDEMGRWIRRKYRGAAYLRSREIVNGLLAIMLMADRRVGKRRKQAVAGDSPATTRIWEKLRAS